MIQPARIREAGSPRGIAQRAGILLHGRGHTPDEKVDLAARLGRLEAMRWLAPGADLGSWYPNRYYDPIELNEPFLTDAVERCHQAVVDAGENGRLGPERIAVVGFSQGACIAMEYALRYPRRCGTVIVFTGGLMGPPGTHPRAGAPSLKGLRVLITGSDVDEWIPEESTHEAARALAQLGADVTTRIYQGRHHVVSNEEVAEARALLQTL